MWILRGHKASKDWIVSWQTTYSLSIGERFVHLCVWFSVLRLVGTHVKQDTLIQDPSHFACLPFGRCDIWKHVLRLDRYVGVEYGALCADSV